MASRMDKWGWELPYAGYFGGVATLSVKQFEQVLKLRPLGDICIDSIFFRSMASPTCFGAGGQKTTTCRGG